MHTYKTVHTYIQAGTLLDLVVIDNSWASHRSSVIVTYHVEPPASAAGRHENNVSRGISGNTYIHAYIHNNVPRGVSGKAYMNTYIHLYKHTYIHTYCVDQTLPHKVVSRKMIQEKSQVWLI